MDFKFEIVREPANRGSLYISPNGYSENGSAVVISCSMPFLERLLNGNYDAQDYSKRKNLPSWFDERLQKRTGKGKVLENLAFESLIQYPFYIDHEDFSRGFKPLSVEDLDKYMSVPTNTIQQETELFKSFNYYRKGLIEESKGILTSEETTHSLEKLRTLYSLFKNTSDFRFGLFVKNQGLVYHILEDLSSEQDTNDLFSVGFESLDKSVMRFDTSRNNRFSTYACTSIIRNTSRAKLNSKRYEILVRRKGEYEQSRKSDDDDFSEINPDSLIKLKA